MSKAQLSELHDNDYSLKAKPFRTGDKVVLLPSSSTVGHQDKEYNVVLICDVFIGKCRNTRPTALSNIEHLRKMELDCVFVTTTDGDQTKENKNSNEIEKGFHVIHNANRILPRCVLI